MPTTADAPATLHVAGDTLAVSGDLGFHSVTGVLDAGRDAIAGLSCARLVLDLGGVDKADSAGVALVVDWLRAARARQLAVEVRGVPAQFAEIARLGGLASIFGLGEAEHAA